MFNVRYSVLSTFCSVEDNYMHTAIRSIDILPREKNNGEVALEHPPSTAARE